MAKATHGLSPAVTLSKLDTRATFHAAYGMARRMVRQRPGRSTGEALTWYLDHGFRRFGFNALPIVRAAGWAAFDAHHVSKAATGTREELARQGMLTRCVRLEQAPRGGWCWAWTHDDLASPNAERCLRRGAAVRLRADRARRREVARAMAEDRRGMERSGYGLTLTGLFALQNAEGDRLELALEVPHA